MFVNMPVPLISRVSDCNSAARLTTYYETPRGSMGAAQAKGCRPPSGPRATSLCTSRSIQALEQMGGQGVDVGVFA